MGENDRSRETRSGRKPERKVAVDLFERSVARDGRPQELDERLFMQLQVFTGCRRIDPVLEAVRECGFPCVLYQDVNDPRGLGFLAMSTDPAHFVTRVRDLLSSDPFQALRHRPDFSMLGRSYATGHEPDLRDWLLEKPRRTVLAPDQPWALWYPLRRTGAFAVLPEAERNQILVEHARIGMAYGQAGLAHDVRLACHGLDAHDNEFIIGLIGRRLHPLSHVVQTMRRTRQTSQFIRSMGPFFVGHTLWQSPAG
ncbi:MAG: chlorite dismutase family protein [Acidobacteriota bacterium]